MKSNLNDRIMKGGEESAIIPVYYIRDGVRVPHHFYDRTAETKEVVTWAGKGVRRILEECGLGLWEEFKAKNNHWKAKCGGDPAEDNT
ncbi:hypothetical protein DFQ28_006347 [Apophysomyces sp. BC1034]|nr:hypothetical protein DFQ28_006347 [Apophysomyces sp. BC1034]